MYDKVVSLAIEAADKAGKVLKNEDPFVNSKVGKDIKLTQDKISEKIIIDVLSSSAYPILSEESGYVTNRRKQVDENGYRWIIDPLDGTANFWRGMADLACISIALWKYDEPVFGIINCFMKDELYLGIVGNGAFLNGKTIRTSGISRLSEAFIATGFPIKRNYGTESLCRFIKEVQQFKKVRMFGSAAIMGAMVAVGRLDVYIEEDIMLWDIAASIAVVKAAGGVSDIQILDENKCVCKLFANKELYHSYLKGIENNA